MKPPRAVSIILHALAAGAWISFGALLKHPALLVAFVALAVIHTGIAWRLMDDE